MEFEKIIEKIENFGVSSASYWGNALAGEVGEACNLIKKFERDNKDIKDDLALELADIFIYTSLTSDHFEIDLEKAILYKLEILQYKLGKKLCEKCGEGKVTRFNKIYPFLCGGCLWDKGL